jgi:hypothetical protein
MRKLKLFEQYVESADYKISVFFKELESQIKKWFTDGSLAAQGCELVDIQVSNINPMEKLLIFKFTEPVAEEDNMENIESFWYRVIFMIRLDQMKNIQPEQEEDVVGPAGIPVEGKALDIDKVLLKIHQFDDDNVERSELVEEVAIDDRKEDFIIDKIGELKDKSEKEPDEVDLKDNVHIKNN